MQYGMPVAHPVEISPAELGSACELVVGQQEVQLILNGDLTIADSVNVHKEALRAVSLGVALVVDLSAATYLDAAILQLLAAVRTSATGMRIPFTLQHASEAVVNDARMLGLSKVLLDHSVTT